MAQLLIQNGNTTYAPTVMDDVQWTTKRQGEAGSLHFTVLDDGKLKIEEGNAVRFQYDGKKVFLGFIFDIEHDKENLIDIIAYDQLRYLKNKDTYIFTNKRADQILKMLANDFGMNVGTLTNSRYVIPSMVEDNKTLFDMINNALSITLQNSGEQYIFYDDFGKLTLRRMQDLAITALIDKDTAENYKYKSSIDEDTYNRVKLIRENEEKGTREIFIAQDGKNINKWGVLQHFDTVGEDENGKSKADALLRLYNTKTKTLEVTNQFGDTRVRGGTMLPVSLQLNDTRVSNMMLVEKVTHTFKKDEHFMDLTLWGGEFSA